MMTKANMILLFNLLFFGTMSCSPKPANHDMADSAGAAIESASLHAE